MQRQKSNPPDSIKAQKAKKDQIWSLRKLAELVTKKLWDSQPKPYYNENTFFVWEPCSRSHAEVVPGYCKLLLDAGYEVSVLIEPKRIEEGLFSNFKNERLHINQLSKRAIWKFFKKNGLDTSSGILITTVGKLTTKADYERARQIFAPLSKKQRVLLVEHDVKSGVDLGTLTSDIITLRETDYKNSITTVINPHYFGDFEEHKKGSTTIFATVGAIRSKRRSSGLLMSAVESLHEKGINNFSVLVIGKSDGSTIPKHLQKYFQILGHLNFQDLYKQIEGCDFLLPLLDADNQAHKRYITTGTSGTFQLALGFRKPMIIQQSFAPINKLNDNNSILYEANSDFQLALGNAINMNSDNYNSLQNAIKQTAKSVYMDSLSNLKRLL